MTIKKKLRSKARWAKDFVGYQFGMMTGRRGRKFEGGYSRWRSRRIQTILDEYGHRFFEDKTVLEVGAGFGDIGAFFGELGANVTCLEGRPQNVRIIEQRYPFVKAVQHDLNAGLPGTEKYDVFIHMGVLYHVANPEASLREACKRCEHLILETEVADSDDPNFVATAREYSYMYDQALDGVGSRPSPALVERVMKEEGFTFRRLNDARCNADLHTYDWQPQNNRQFRNGLRRMWFAQKPHAAK